MFSELLVYFFLLTINCKDRSLILLVVFPMTSLEECLTFTIFEVGLSCLRYKIPLRRIPCLDNE